MSLTRAEYEECIAKDLKALAYSDDVDRHHIKDVLVDSVGIYYDLIPAVRRIIENNCKDGDVAIVEKYVYRGAECPCEGFSCAVKPPTTECD